MFKFRADFKTFETYKSRLGGASKHCSQKRVRLVGRSLNAEADKVRGNPALATLAMPSALKDGELMPPSQRLRPLIGPPSSIEPPLDPDILSTLLFPAFTQIKLLTSYHIPCLIILAGFSSTAIFRLIIFSYFFNGHWIKMIQISILNRTVKNLHSVRRLIVELSSISGFLIVDGAS